jgi:hypothetical protein
MKRILIALALAIAVSPALAGDVTTGMVTLPGTLYCTTIPCIPDNKKSAPMVITTVFEVFRMGDGACLKGPLSINDGRGTKFELSAGADFPAGCSKAQR